MESNKQEQEEEKITEEGCSKQIEKQNEVAIQGEQNKIKKEELSLIPVYTKIEQKNIEVNEKLFEQVEQKKNKGNIYYKQKKYNEAITEYKNAIKSLKTIEESAQNKSKQQIQSKACILFSNIGYCCFAVKQFKQAEQYFTVAISCNSNYMKAIYKRALCRYNLQKYQQAWQDIKLARNLDQKNEDIKQAFKQIQKKVNHVNQKSKQMYQKMFNSPSKINNKNKSQTLLQSGMKSQRSQKSNKTSNSIKKQENLKADGGSWLSKNYLLGLGLAVLVGVGFYKKWKW